MPNEDYRMVNAGSLIADQLQEILLRKKLDARQSMLDALAREDKERQWKSEEARDALARDQYDLDAPYKKALVAKTVLDNENTVLDSLQPGLVSTLSPEQQELAARRGLTVANPIEDIPDVANPERTVPGVRKFIGGPTSVGQAKKAEIEAGIKSAQMFKDIQAAVVAGKLTEAQGKQLLIEAVGGKFDSMPVNIRTINGDTGVQIGKDSEAPAGTKVITTTPATSRAGVPDNWQFLRAETVNGKKFDVFYDTHSGAQKRVASAEGATTNYGKYVPSATNRTIPDIVPKHQDKYLDDANELLAKAGSPREVAKAMAHYDQTSKNFIWSADPGILAVAQKTVIDKARQDYNAGKYTGEVKHPDGKIEKMDPYTQMLRHVFDQFLKITGEVEQGSDEGNKLELQGAAAETLLRRVILPPTPGK